MDFSYFSSLLVWALADPAELASSFPTQLNAALALLIPAGMVVYARRFELIWRVSSRIVIGLMGVAIFGAFAIWRFQAMAPLRGLALIAILVLLLVRPHAMMPAWRETPLWEQLFRQPARVLIVSFAGTCVMGGVLLSLPICASGRPVAFLDAFFTSVSATCVTGLVVLDTPVDFSGAGQGVILLLIQVGGLGIMTFYAAAAVLLRLRMRLQEERAVFKLVGRESRAGLKAALKTMLLVTVVMKGLGTVCLSSAFWHLGDPLLHAIWRGLFTAVSAYCNAGFALQSESLIPYQEASFVLHVVAALIIIGGLGPAVVLGLIQTWSRRRLVLHARLVVITTALLIVIPAALMAAFEWSNTLEELPVWDRLSNAYFQSVTTRTAGFNAIDLGAARPETLVLTEVLMFIGGSPGSTAGGVKTTTIALLSGMR